MRINVLFIKRRFALDDAPEAYACFDDDTYDSNPDWPDEQVRRMLADCGSDMQGGSWRWVALDVSCAAVERVFTPEPIQATVKREEA